MELTPYMKLLIFSGFKCTLKVCNYCLCLDCHKVTVSNFYLPIIFNSHPGVMRLLSNPPGWLNLGLEDGAVRCFRFYMANHLHPSTGKVNFKLNSVVLHFIFCLYPYFMEIKRYLSLTSPSKNVGLH